MYIEFLDMSLWGVLGRLILGLAIGFLIGLTGIGGGVLVIPALTLILGIDPVKAVGTTSLYAFLTKISATFHHARLKTIDWGVAARFLAGAIPAATAVAVWVSGQSGNAEFQLGLKRFIAGVVLFSIFIMTLNLIRQSRSATEQEEHTLAARVNGHPLLRLALGITVGGAIGALVGATSIQGVIIIPTLILIFNLSTARTVGTSILIALMLTFVTAMIYGKGGETDKATAIIMAAGSLGGVYFGSRLSARMPERILKTAVLVLIFIAAILMLINQGC